jgi:EcsC protein family
MASSGSDGPHFGPIERQLAGAAVAALPPEVQELFKPAPQSARITKAIGWAARPDPAVLELHRRHGSRNVRTLADIANVPLEKMDEVAQHIARNYRRRAALTGALTGLPGGPWAIVAAGFDVQLTAVYAVRMVSAVAQSYGYDPSKPEELAQLAEVLALVAGVDTLRGIGNWITREGLEHYLPEILPRLLVYVGAEITKEQAARFVGRLVPGIGALIAGSIDYSFLRVAGAKAVTFYHHRYLVEHGLAAPEVTAGPAIAALPSGVAQALPPKPGVGGQVVIPHATPKRRERPPERIGIYLAIFAVLALALTIAACAIIVVLISAGLHHAFGLAPHSLEAVAAAIRPPAAG